jgi:tRNA (guanine37-N1)-methyltransferase
MRIDILTTFPEMFDGPLSASIVGRAREAGIVDIRVRNLRDFTHDRHRITDDTPYGGGGGMVMKPEPIVEAVETIRAEADASADIDESLVISLTPQGRPYDQATAQRLSERDHLVLICGHYEEIDDRVRQLVVDEEVSIGDYVLTGGELPAMILVDSVVRLLPGAVGNPESIRHESFVEGLLDCPHYTRPEEFRGLRVPDVLLSGHHAEIDRWRRREALERTWRRRPDLLARAPLTAEDRRMLEEIRREDASRESDE